MKSSFIMKRLPGYIILMGGLLLIYFVPDHILFNQQLELCILKKTTGINCPLCGMTNATHELLHFRFVNAFNYNALIYLLSALLLLDLLVAITGNDLIVKIRKITIWIFFIGILFLFVIRIFHRFN